MRSQPGVLLGKNAGFELATPVGLVLAGLLTAVARDVSILFADLEGFTAFSARTPPGDVAAMLNTYFVRLLPPLEGAGGEVHQLVGDEIMAIFNKQGDQPDHPRLAAQAALDLQDRAAEITSEHPTWPRFRVGVNSGEVLAGLVGGDRGHRKHGVVGTRPMCSTPFPPDPTELQRVSLSSTNATSST